MCRNWPKIKPVLWHKAFSPGGKKRALWGVECVVISGYRYYSPELGRWLTKDPLDEFGGINLYAFAFNNSINLIDYLGLACELEDVIVNSLKGAASGYLKTLIAKKVITTAVKVAAAQVAPVAGQIVGVGMTAWEVISFGRTAYTVYVNSDKIREALQNFYDDPKIVEWIKCLTEEECKKLAIQLGEVIGSFVANRKEAKEGIRRVKDVIKKYISLGKAKYKNSPLGNEIGSIGGIGASKSVDPSKIRFSQDSIKAPFKNPKYGTIDDLAEGLRSGNVKPSDVKPIRLVERDGKLISIDNRTTI